MFGSNEFVFLVAHFDFIIIFVLGELLKVDWDNDGSPSVGNKFTIDWTTFYAATKSYNLFASLLEDVWFTSDCDK